MSKSMIKNKLQSFIRVVKAHPVIPVSMVVCLCLFSSFAEVVDDVMEGDSHALDTRILLMLRDPGNPDSPLGPLWLEEMMRDLTGLGGIIILSLITVAAAIYLLVIRRTGHAVYLLSAVGSGIVLSNAFKLGFDRPRPDLVPHDSIVYMSSFPSGHTLMAAITYLTLGAILAETEPRRSMKIYLTGLAVVITLLVGVSRVYLGVHWPSDVLAGWLAGAGWALMFWVFSRYLKAHRLLKPEQAVAAGG